MPDWLGIHNATDSKEKESMKSTTLCYIEKDEKFLMLYRNKKENDMNEGKWLGIGGKIEPGETPDECCVREVYEETGIKLNSYHFYGVIKFRATTYEDEDMYLYSSTDFELPDELPDCNEGELRWVAKKDLLDLPMWEGDKAFIAEILAGKEKIEMTLQYVGEECTIITK